MNISNADDAPTQITTTKDNSGSEKYPTKQKITMTIFTTRKRKKKAPLVLMVLLLTAMMIHSVDSFTSSSSSSLSSSLSVAAVRPMHSKQGRNQNNNLFNTQLSPPPPCSSSYSKIQNPFQTKLSTRNNPNVRKGTFAIFATPPLPPVTAAAAAGGGVGLATLTTNMFHNDLSFVLSSVLLLSVFGVTLERRTTFGKALSAPLATMALALTVANVGIIPFSSPIYNIISKFLVPLAVPLLLFDSDLNRVLSDTGSLLTAFFVGAISTVVATIITFPLVPLKSLGPNQGWKVACALAARHIGGAINFVAVADTLNVGGSAVSAAIAADNVVVALYFAFLFYLAKAGEEEAEGDGSINNTGGEGGEQQSSSDESNEEEEVKIDIQDPESVASDVAQEGSKANAITMPAIGISVAVSSCLVTLGGLLTKLILPKGTSSLPLTSILTVIAATTFPTFFSQIRSAGTAVGIFFIQMFFAASGASGSIGLVMKSAPSLFLFSVLQIGIHFGMLMGFGRVMLRLKKNDLYLASNACVGGPTTAAAMAQAKEWKRSVLPALLIGILGYASATAIALALGPVLLRLPLL